MAKIWDPTAVEAEIARLQSLGIAALRAEWAALFKEPAPPSLTKDLLGRMIAYRLQERIFGGLDRETKRLLANLAAAKTAPDLPQRLKPGTALVRDYQGIRHDVTIRREGYVWQNRVYSSLSAIAKAITGTSWNGRRFFGVESAQLIAPKARHAAETITALPTREAATNITPAVAAHPVAHLKSRSAQRGGAKSPSATAGAPRPAPEAPKPIKFDADGRSVPDGSLTDIVGQKAKPTSTPRLRAKRAQIVELAP